MAEWYIVYNGQNIGPMSKENLLAYNPTPESLVWKEGMENWQPIYTIPELMELIAGRPATPSYAPGMSGAVPPSVPQNVPYTKSKVTAGILALLVGTLGIQYFYLGKVGGGLVTILLSIVTCGFWGLIVFIQGILMLTMSDEEFDRKFVRSNSFMPLF